MFSEWKICVWMNATKLLAGCFRLFCYYFFFFAKWKIFEDEVGLLTCYSSFIFKHCYFYLVCFLMSIKDFLDCATFIVLINCYNTSWYYCTYFHFLCIYICTYMWWCKNVTVWYIQTTFMFFCWWRNSWDFWHVW